MSGERMVNMPSGIAIAGALSNLLDLAMLILSTWTCLDLSPSFMQFNKFTCLVTSNSSVLYYAYICYVFVEVLKKDISLRKDLIIR